ncbi:hypothetical protein CspHIS471_0602440 [Cutaneotrichosporon sp. HIS471]|nr:hypothetical protein CspHIS471_0602440 [Cutaneotrichosporon sp. HIS471]
MVANDVATSPAMSTTPLAHPKALNVGPIGLLADVALGYSPRKFDNHLPPISHLTGEVRAPAPRRAPRRLSPTGWKDGDAQSQRRKEQNAQAQKKFRWKKKVLQEQMRADLEEQRALVEELQQKCAAFEDIQFALAEAQADNARLAARLEACSRKVESV